MSSNGTVNFRPSDVDGMSQVVFSSSAPAPLLRRGFDWWLAQVKHALPPTIFFFIGFNLIV